MIHVKSRQKGWVIYLGHLKFNSLCSLENPGSGICGFFKKLYGSDCEIIWKEIYGEWNDVLITNSMLLNISSFKIYMKLNKKDLVISPGNIKLISV